MTIVLKLACDGNFHRLVLDQPATMANADEVIRRIYPHSGVDAATVVDADGNIRKFTIEDLEAYQSIARSSQAGNKTVIKLLLPSAVESTLNAAVAEQSGVSAAAATFGSASNSLECNSSPIEPIESFLDCSDVQQTHEDSSDWKVADDIEPQSDVELVERIRAECEAEVVRHLDTWLSENTERPRYESWIAACHPENAHLLPNGDYRIDQRMYLEASFHRNAWNTHAENASDIDAEERQHRIVDASGCDKRENRSSTSSEQAVPPNTAVVPSSTEDTETEKTANGAIIALQGAVAVGRWAAATAVAVAERAVAARTDHIAERSQRADRSRSADRYQGYRRAMPIEV